MLAEFRISLIHRARMGWKTETCTLTAYACDIVICNVQTDDHRVLQREDIDSSPFDGYLRRTEFS